MSDTDDQRRQRPISVLWDGMVGRLLVDGKQWAAVEWSKKRQAWCIEDAEGKCLRHAASIHGQAAAKEEAIAIAQAMICDGTMPSPEQARELHKDEREREREKRANRPSDIRRRQEREKKQRLMDRCFDLQREERFAQPFYEIFADAFDLADPELWKSNSFSAIRPRLIIEVTAAIASMEYDLHDRKGEQRGLPDIQQLITEDEAKLARAREILRLLDPH